MVKHCAAALSFALTAGLLVSCNSGAELRVTGTSMVVGPPRGHPVLCSGVRNLSLPPSCLGVPLRGLDVSELVGAQAAGGTTWVDRASVTGVYDDGVLRVEEVGSPQAFPKQTYDFSPGCPAPRGGWPAFDKRTNDRRAEAELTEYRKSQPQTYAGAWFDQATGVFTFLFTDGLEEHRVALERILPGRICVAKRKLSLRMLTHISNRLHKGPSAAYLKKHDITLTGASVNERLGRVEIDVVIGGPERQRKLDERYAKYGHRVVVIRSALLRPV